MKKFFSDFAWYLLFLLMVGLMAAVDIALNLAFLK